MSLSTILLGEVTEFCLLCERKYNISGLIDIYLNQNPNNTDPRGTPSPQTQNAKNAKTANRTPKNIPSPKNTNVSVKNSDDTYGYPTIWIDNTLFIVNESNKIFAKVVDNEPLPLSQQDEREHRDQVVLGKLK